MRYLSIVHKPLFDQVQLVLQSKLDDFKMQRYTEITMEEMWNYCIKKKWKKRQVEDILIYEIVATIYSLTPSEIVSQAHINELYKTDLNLGINLEELNLLLKPLKSEWMYSVLFDTTAFVFHNRFIVLIKHNRQM